MLTTYDGTKVRLYVFKRGTKVMRIYAATLGDATDEAVRLNFRPPYESVVLAKQSDVEEAA